MEEGYSLCFNKWALDKDIKNELGLLLIISSLCAEKGYCYASNKYFSELFNLPENTISIKIKKLEQKGYIFLEYEKRGCEIIKRFIRIEKNQIDGLKKIKSTVLKKSKENNISINNISNKNIYYEDNELNELFLEYLQVRKKLKAINSDRAIKMLINKLEQYDNITKYKMIEQSIVNSWKDVYPLKSDTHQRKVIETPTWLGKKIIETDLSRNEQKEIENILKEFR